VPAAGAPLGFCLESTGTDGTALATTRASAGRHVSVVNPARIKYAGLMRGRGNQTDKADARLIAEYAQRERPTAWPPPPREPAHYRARCALAAREKGRRAAPGRTDAVRESIRRTVAFLEGEADRRHGQADTWIADAEQLRGDRAVPESVP